MEKPGPDEIRRLRDNPEEMAKTCQLCRGKCCTYVAIEIDEPEDFDDFQNIRWYAAHKNVWVFMDDDEWYVAFDSPCEHLGEDFLCTTYENRPDVCRNHKFGECDYFLDGEFDLELRSMAEVDEYLKKRFPRKMVKRPQRKK